MWPKPRKPEFTDLIDEGSEIEGKYTFAGTAVVNGKFQGEIQSSETLIIGEKGVVKANIRAGALIVSGELVGSVVAAERVDIRTRARVIGDIEAPVVVIEEGAFFEGHCRMNHKTPASQKPTA